MSAIVAAPLHMVQAVAALRFPAVSDRRLQILMDRNNDGELTAEERDELESLAELSEAISLVRADALAVLGRNPGCTFRLLR
jgi:hypothetical protein